MPRLISIRFRFPHFPVLLLLAAATTLAAERPEPAFTIRLEGVKFDYPGAEHWAQIERPDGGSVWAFAIYAGHGTWTVPFPADTAGTYRLRRVESRRGDQRADDKLAGRSGLWKSSRIKPSNHSRRRSRAWSMQANSKPFLPPRNPGASTTIPSCRDRTTPGTCSVLRIPSLWISSKTPAVAWHTRRRTRCCSRRGKPSRRQ